MLNPHSTFVAQVEPRRLEPIRRFNAKRHDIRKVIEAPSSAPRAHMQCIEPRIHRVYRYGAAKIIGPRSERLERTISIETVTVKEAPTIAGVHSQTDDDLLKG